MKSSVATTRFWAILASACLAPVAYLWWAAITVYRAPAQISPEHSRADVRRFLGSLGLKGAGLHVLSIEGEEIHVDWIDAGEQSPKTIKKYRGHLELQPMLVHIENRPEWIDTTAPPPVSVTGTPEKYSVEFTGRFDPELGRFVGSPIKRGGPKLRNETVHTDRILYRAREEWKGRGGPGKRGLSLIIPRSPPALFVTHFDPQELTERIRRGEPDLVKKLLRTWGYVMPLETHEDKVRAVQVLHTYLFGRSGDRVSSKVEAASRWVVGLIGSRVFTSIASCLLVIALFLWGCYAWWIGGLIRRYRRFVPSPWAALAVFPFLPRFMQSRRLVEFERLRSESVRDETEQQREEERSQRIAAKAAAEAEASEHTGPVVEPPEPTLEEITALAEHIHQRLAEPDVPGSARKQVLQEMEAALAQRSRRRAMRMLKHAGGLLKQNRDEHDDG